MEASRSSRGAWIETRRVDAAAKRDLARYVGDGMERLIDGYGERDAAINGGGTGAWIET